MEQEQEEGEEKGKLGKCVGSCWVNGLGCIVLTIPRGTRSLVKDVTMKNELSTSDLMNGNWVSKRKRKKIPSGAIKLNGNVADSVPSESLTSNSSKDKLKKESSSDFGPTKERGHD
ncbi:hypothetical protein M8C21_031707, partial [Ambrosia artemisiifolia]